MRSQNPWIQKFPIYLSCLSYLSCPSYHRRKNLSLMYRMDASLLASAGVSTSVVAGLFIAYKIFMSLKGHRLVSDCCGRKGEVGFDVRDMPPSPPTETQSRPPPPPSVDAKPQNLSVKVPEPSEHREAKETA